MRRLIRLPFSLRETGHKLANKAVQPTVTHWRFGGQWVRLLTLDVRLNRTSFTMYPVSLGIDEAKIRINALLKNGHSAEALVTGVFTIEKTIRRVLRQLIVSAGFSSKSADAYIKNCNGFAALKSQWAFFDPHEHTLPQIIGEVAWNAISAQETGYAYMRNQMIHGSRVYNLLDCEAKAKALLITLDVIINSFQSAYGYSGWTRPSTRKTHYLHRDPKVKYKPNL